MFPKEWWIFLPTFFSDLTARRRKGSSLLTDILPSPSFAKLVSNSRPTRIFDFLMGNIRESDAFVSRRKKTLFWNTVTLYCTFETNVIVHRWQKQHKELKRKLKKRRWKFARFAPSLRQKKLQNPYLASFVQFLFNNKKSARLLKPSS